MEELQRDVADLEQKVDDLQKGLLDPKTGSITALQMAVQQAQETANKTNGTLNGLNSGLMNAVQSSLKGLSDQLNSVVGLSTAVNSISSDLSNVESTMKDMQSQVNKQSQVLNDLVNQVKLLQAPAAPAPGSDASGVAGGGPQPDPGTLFTNAKKDQDSGNGDLAITEYKKFLSLFSNDNNAIRAQYNIGSIYYGQGHLDDALTALDAALEQYPVDQSTTPSALYMKGLTLKKQNKKTEAATVFRDVVRQYPHSEEAPEATAQLHNMGATTTSAPAKKSPVR
jgi:TolA-binding protein